MKKEVYGAELILERRNREERKEVRVLVELKSPMSNEEFQLRLRNDLQKLFDTKIHPTEEDVKKLAQKFVDENFFTEVKVVPHIKGAHET